MKTYRINEMFYSLQGEGVRVGTPAIFIRFAGCNLKCSFCDTRHSAGMRMTLGQVMAFVRVLGKTNFVILTGGEPMLQADTPLVRALAEAGFQVGIETNGTIAIPSTMEIRMNWVTVSPKLQWNASGRKFYESIKQRRCTELKVVCPNGIPGMGEMNVQDMASLTAFFDAEAFMLQPCSMKNVRETADLVLEAGTPWRLSFQTQKVIGIR